MTRPRPLIAYRGTVAPPSCSTCDALFRVADQSQIATRIGVSQMHVSRLLARALAQRRDGLTGG